MGRQINLDDTIDAMLSSDYKMRFKAEYFQLKIRRDKLKMMLENWDKGEINFSPTCPREIYDDQIAGMNNYLSCLEERAEIENVDLTDLEN